MAKEQWSGKLGITLAWSETVGNPQPAVAIDRFLTEMRPGELPRGLLGYVAARPGEAARRVLINLPQAKSHSNTGVSLGIKNLMGLIWDRWSFHTKYNFNQALADLATVIRPQLTILDATRALISGGPGGPGEVRRPNLIIAGTDPVAVDSYGVTVVPWYGQSFKGRQIEHLLAAHQRGLGKIDLEPLRIFKGSA